jgi:hypothetical protein
MDERGQENDRGISWELAVRLHVTHRTVRRWAQEGYSLHAIFSALSFSEGVEEPGWLSVAAVAARFDIDERTVRRWISAGYVHARRFGPKLIRVSLRTVLEHSDQVGAPNVGPRRS